MSISHLGMKYSSNNSYFWQRSRTWGIGVYTNFIFFQGCYFFILVHRMLNMLPKCYNLNVCIIFSNDTISIELCNMWLDMNNIQVQVGCPLLSVFSWVTVIEHI